MGSASISKPCASKVTGLAAKVAKSGYKLAVSASWKVPSSATNGSSSSRAEGSIYSFALSSNVNYDATTMSDGGTNFVFSGPNGTTTIEEDPRYRKTGYHSTTKNNKASWSGFDRRLAYPFTKKSTTMKFVKVYTYNGVAATWLGNRWYLEPNWMLDYKWIRTSDLKSLGITSWDAISRNPLDPGWSTGMVRFYKSLTDPSETTTHKTVGGLAPTIDRISILVALVNRWNYEVSSYTEGTSFKRSGVLTFKKVSKPKGSPRKNGYYIRVKHDDGYVVYYKDTNDAVIDGMTYYTTTFHGGDLFATNWLGYGIKYQRTLFKFEKPGNPSITTSVGKSDTNHTLTVRFKSTDDKSNKKERWDTKYSIYYSCGVRTSSDKFKVYGPYKLSDFSKSNTKLDFNVKIKPNSYLGKHNSSAYVTSLEEGEWLKFDVHAKNRGMAGDSSIVKKSFLYAWPHATVLNTPVREGQHYKIDFKVAKPTGNSANERRSTKSFTLQRLANYMPNGSKIQTWTNEQWKRSASESDAWTDVYSIGSEERAFSDNVHDAMFEPMHRTYYRVKSEPIIDGMPPIYSEPIVVPGYAVLANVANDPAEIIELSSVDNGRAVRVVVGFTRTSNLYVLSADPTKNPHSAGLYERYTDKNKKVRYRITPDTFARNGKNYYTKINSNPILNSNGTEISWSDKNYGWKSSEQPSTFDCYDEEFGVYNRLNAVNGTINAKPTITESRIKKFPKWKTSKKSHFQTFYISGLELGREYWVRARRFLKGTELSEDQYGAYAKFTKNGVETPVVPKSAPKKVRLATTSVISYGSAVDLSWTYDDIGWTTSEAYSSQPQEKYSVYVLTGSTNSAKAKSKVLSGYSSVVDSSTHASIKFSSIKNYLKPMSNSKAEMRHILFFMVRVCVGGVWSEQSNIVAVTFVKAPTATIILNGTVLKSLPLTATLKTNDPSAYAIVRVTNVNGCASWLPYGTDYQAEGTIIYSRKYRPTWSAPDSNGWCSATWSSGISDLDFRDGGRYQVDFMATNEYNGDVNLNSSFELYEQDYAENLASHYNDQGIYLGSSATQWGSPMNYDYATDSYPFDSAKYDKNGTRVCASAQFDVSWSHQAVAMPLYTGKGGIPASKCIMPPKLTKSGVEFTLPKLWPGAAANDTIDMYRVTPDGAYLVKSGLSQGTVVTDTMPMYSNYATCRYRFATRTFNGDVEWVDVPSGMSGHAVRFDWGTDEAELHGGYSHLELPYNLTWSDQWTKQTRIQLHMDGTYSGYWRGGVDRKNSLSAVLLKFDEREQIERLKALAKHEGPVYVRLPDGCAFCANVEVSNLDNTYNGLLQNVSITAQEITMIPQFSTEAVV